MCRIRFGNFEELQAVLSSVRMEADGSFSIDVPDGTPTKDSAGNSAEAKDRKMRTSVDTEKLGELVELITRCPRLKLDELSLLLGISKTVLTHNQRVKKLLNSQKGSARADAQR